MSNDEHDTHEPTGARLTEAQVAKIAQTAEHFTDYYLTHRDNDKAPAAPTPDADDEPTAYDTVFRQAFTAAWRQRGMSFDAAYLIAHEAADAWAAAPTPDAQEGGDDGN